MRNVYTEKKNRFILIACYDVLLLIQNHSYCKFVTTNWQQQIYYARNNNIWSKIRREKKKQLHICDFLVKHFTYLYVCESIGYANNSLNESQIQPTNFRLTCIKSRAHMTIIQMDHFICRIDSELDNDSASVGTHKRQIK